jgi:flagellin
MEAQVRGISKAIGNANDAVSLSQTAEGALNEVTGILQRIRELTVQASSETNTLGDRQKIQAEIDELIEEVDNIGSAQFNGKSLFGSQFDFHLGAGNDGGSSVGLRTDKLASNRLGAHSLYTSGAVDTATAINANDLTIVTREGDSVVVRASESSDDSVSTANQSGSAIAKAAAINSGTKDHGVTAQAGMTTLTSTGINAEHTLDRNDVLTINGEKISGFTVSENDADGSLVDAINAVSEETGVVASLNGSGNLQLIAEDGRNIAIGATGTAANLGFTDGTVQGGTLTLESRDSYTLQFAAEEVNTDALGNITTVGGGGGNNFNNLVNGRFTFVGANPVFTAEPVGALWDATTEIISVTGTYDSTVSPFPANQEFYIAFDDGNTAVYIAGNDASMFADGFINSADFTTGTFTIANIGINLTFELGNPANIDADNDDDGDGGAFKFQLTDGNIQFSAGTLESVMGQNFAESSLSGLAGGELHDVTTTAGAERALSIIDIALEEVSATRAELGALNNRLESTVNNLDQTKNNISSARSQIMDADFAAETAQLSKSQIIQQASVSMLAQANASQQVALSLI